jgi:nucleoside-diphosphate-sugar epimerase
LGAVRNRRLLIDVDDLADLIVTVAVSGARAPILLAADPEPISTPAMVRSIAEGLGRPARLLPVPPAILTATGRLTGRRHLVDQLCGSLEVDAAATVAATGWRPAHGMPAGLEHLGASVR